MTPLNRAFEATLNWCRNQVAPYADTIREEVEMVRAAQQALLKPIETVDHLQGWNRAWYDLRVRHALTVAHANTIRGEAELGREQRRCAHAAMWLWAWWEYQAEALATDGRWNTRIVDRLANFRAK